MNNLPFSQACENNKAPILDHLCRWLNAGDRVLEIGSGTAQHAVYFASQLPHCHWLCADLPEHHATIAARLQQHKLPNCEGPLVFDALQSHPPQWPSASEPVNAIFTANTLHIMPWSAVESLFGHWQAWLPQKALVIIYGPFNYEGCYTSASNANFDASLRARGVGSAIRDIESIIELAEQAQLELLEDNAMPANNRLLVMRKV